MAEIQGAEAVLEAFVAEGVDTIFGYPGGAIMPVYDALYDYDDRIRHILVRHEQGAAHAAQGYARITGKPGVCMATSGPGATNLITGIADAMIDSVPMVCLTGQVPSSVLGTDAFQEVDVLSLTMPITKWNHQITCVEEVAEVMAKAFYVARTGRPGPVLVDITKDAQVSSSEFAYTPLESYPHAMPVKGVDQEKIKEAAELLNNAERPYILLGHGVLIAQAEAEVLSLAEKAGIPVGCTLHGLSGFPSAHPLYAGMLGMHGNYGSNVLSNEADVVLAVGMRFDDRVTGDVRSYLPKARVIHIEIDPAEINKIVKADVPIHADAKEALTALLPEVKDQDRSDWVDRFHQCNVIEHEKIIEKGISSEREQIGMIEVIKMLSDKAHGEAVVVADVGQHQMMAARYFEFVHSGSFVTSGGLGTMGFALPAAMGCQIAAPDRQVITIVGDGCFQMTLQELATIAQEKLPVKIVVLNNNFLGMVRQWQQLFFAKRYSFVELENPDFIKITEGFGIEAARVTERGDLEAAIDKLFEVEGAYLLEVVVEKEENVFPMVPSGQSISDIRLE